MVFLAGCRIRILLLFSASASFQLCLPSVPLLCSLCLPSFLSLGYLLTSTSVSLATVPFDWFVYYGTSRLLLSPSLLWFLFIFFVIRSYLGSFATGSSLWAELSRISLTTARRMGELQAVTAAVSSPGGGGGGMRICLIFMISVLSLRQSLTLFRVLFGFLLHGFRGVSSSCVTTLSGSCFASLSAQHFFSFSTPLHFLLCLLVVLIALSLRTLCPSFLDVSFSSLYLTLLPLLFLLPLLVLLLHFIWVLCSSSLLRGFSLGPVVAGGAVV